MSLRMHCFVTLLFAAGCSESAEPVRAKALARATSLKSYRVTLASVIPPDGNAPGAPARATITAEALLPDRLRASATRTDGETTTRLQLLFDGATVVTSTQSGAQPTQLVRAEQTRLAKRGRPFDVGFSMRGFGLIDGEDLRGTIVALLTTWGFTDASRTTFAGRPCVELRGSIKHNVAVDLLVGTDGTRAADALGSLHGDAMANAVAGIIESMSEASVFVTEAGDILGWRLAGPQGLLVETTVVELEHNAPIALERFEIDPATRAAARDITDLAVSHQARPARTPEQLRDFKSKVWRASMR